MRLANRIFHADAVHHVERPCHISEWARPTRQGCRQISTFVSKSSFRSRTLPSSNSVPADATSNSAARHSSATTTRVMVCNTNRKANGLTMQATRHDVYSRMYRSPGRVIFECCLADEDAGTSSAGGFMNLMACQLDDRYLHALVLPELQSAARLGYVGMAFGWVHHGMWVCMWRRRSRKFTL